MVDKFSYLLGRKAAGGGGGGTTNYNALNNKPQIGGVTLQGDKSLSDLGIEQIQVSTMPEASASLVGQIVQYIGATDTYTNGYFYKCVENDGVYSWEASDTQAQPTLNTFNEDDFDVVSNEVSLKPSRRTFVGTRLEWEALTAEQKALYEMVALTDDEDADYKDVYSTSEVKTNKVWIDGKPIYQKTIDCGAMSSSAGTRTVAHNITNIDKVVSYDGMMYHSSGTSERFPTMENGSSFFRVQITASNITIIQSGTWGSWISSYVTIKYTKTTD